MKIVIVFVLTGALVVGPLLVLYTLGKKYRDSKRRKREAKQESKKKTEGAKAASDYQIKFRK